MSDSDFTSMVDDKGGRPLGIILLFEGLPPTIIESQVLAHARMLENIGLRVEVWTFAVTRAAYHLAMTRLEKLQKAYPSSRIRVFRGVRPALPMSGLLNAILLFLHLKYFKMKPSFIHARTELATSVAARLKPYFKFRLIWDARGDGISEFSELAKSFSRFWRLLVPLNLRSIRRRIEVSSMSCDAAIFVSNQLRELQGSRIPESKTLVLPCVADEAAFFFSQKLREEYRKKIGYAPDDVVLIYVGSTSIWQCTDETVKMMEAALRSNRKVRVLVLTPDPEKFRESFSKDCLNKNVSIMKVGLQEVNGYLNAADFGFLLRDRGPINWVASPVKFAEYSLAGLSVVTTDAVAQINEIGKYVKNLVDKDTFYKEISTAVPDDELRKRRFFCAASVLGRRAAESAISQFYLGVLSGH